MTPDPEASSAGKAARPERSRLTTWARRAVFAVLALELVYLIAGNVFLSTDLGRRTLNRKPEKFSVSWERAWTWIPFWVHTRQLELSGNARRASWKVTADSARIFIWVPSLFTKHVNLTDSNGRNVAVEIDLHEAAGPRPAAPRKKRRWRISVGGGDFRPVQRIRIGDLELAGAGILSGAADFQVRGPVDLRLHRLHYENAALTSGEATAASDVDLDAELEVGPFVVGDDQIGDILASTSGEITLEAETESLGFVNAYLSRAPWIEVGGSGHLTLDAELQRGWLAPGSALSLTGSTVEARFVGLRAYGEGKLTGKVPEGTSHTELAVNLDRFSVDREGDSATLVAGEGLRLVATNDTNAIDRPAEGLAVEAHLPPAQIPDLTAFSPYIPEATQVELYGGGAELAADVRFDSTTQEGDGRLTLAGERISGRFQELDLIFDLDLILELDKTHLDRGSSEIDGSSLRVDRATVAGSSEEAKEWWAHIEIPDGAIARPPDSAPGTPPVIEAQLDATLRDSRPLVAMLIERKPKIRWFDGILTVEDVTASSRLEVEGRAMSFRDLEVHGGEKIELLAELDLPTKKERRGVLFARYRKLSAAVALEEDGRDWKLTKSRRWYEEQAAAYRDQTAAEPPAELAEPAPAPQPQPTAPPAAAPAAP